MSNKPQQESSPEVKGEQQVSKRPLESVCYNRQRHWPVLAFTCFLFFYFWTINMNNDRAPELQRTDKCLESLCSLCEGQISLSLGFEVIQVCVCVFFVLLLEGGRVMIRGGERERSKAGLRWWAVAWWEWRQLRWELIQCQMRRGDRWEWGWRWVGDIESRIRPAAVPLMPLHIDHSDRSHRVCELCRIRTRHRKTTGWKHREILDSGLARAHTDVYRGEDPLPAWPPLRRRCRWHEGFVHQILQFYKSSW